MSYESLHNVVLCCPAGVSVSCSARRRRRHASAGRRPWKGTAAGQYVAKVCQCWMECYEPASRRQPQQRVQCTCERLQQGSCVYCHSSSMLMACACVCACREKERREKVEEARRETERILAEQEAEVARRKVSNSTSTRSLPLYDYLS